MAKQSGGMPKIDEDFMKELISQGVPSKQDNNKTNDVPQETQTETVQVEKPTPRRRKGGSGDYRETYFQKVELADRQPLYVSRTTHEKLMRIVTVIGGRKVTVSSYVENSAYNRNVARAGSIAGAAVGAASGKVTGKLLK